MRMWLVDPKVMCRQHLLGEHVELHMCIGSLKKKRSIAGFIRDGLIDPSLILKRHKILAEEMKRRGYNHKSPLIGLDLYYYLKEYGVGNVDPIKNLQELAYRCVECKQLQRYK